MTRGRLGSAHYYQPLLEHLVLSYCDICVWDPIEWLWDTIRPVRDQQFKYYFQNVVMSKWKTSPVEGMLGYVRTAVSIH